MSLSILGRFYMFRSFLAKGPFKDIFLDPNVVWASELFNEFFETDVFLGGPIFPVTTIMVILFMV